LELLKEESTIAQLSTKYGSSVFPGVVAIKVNMGYSGMGKTYNLQ
jgi:hypothetical protein